MKKHNKLNWLKCPTCKTEHTEKPFMEKPVHICAECWGKQQRKIVLTKTLN